MSNAFIIKYCKISDTHTIPYVDIGYGKGDVVLITAGMDGDEYAGIEAAWRLCEQLSIEASWKGRIIIFPIVNTHGNSVGVSINPLDKIYPKHVFPGQVGGSSSQQLIYSIIKSIGTPIDLWIDLHGGSTVEELQPFVWGFSYGDAKTQHKSNQLLSCLGTSTVVKAYWYKAKEIMKRGIVYIVLESGQMGNVEEAAIHQHVSWVRRILLHWNDTQIDAYQYYAFIRYYRSVHTGYWQLEHNSSSVSVNNRLGTLLSLYDSYKSVYRATKEGIFLWRHRGGWVKKGDILYAVAENLRTSKEYK